MANKVTIDIEARFVDNVTDESKAASKAIDGIGKEAAEAGKKLDNLGRKRAKPRLDAEDSKLLRKLTGASSKLNKLKNSKASVILNAVDKGSAIVSKLLGKAKNFAGRTYSAALKFKDSDALGTVRKLTSAAEGFARKTWTGVLKVKNLAMAPLNKVKNALFSIKGLMTAIAGMWATQKVVVEPVGLADAYSSAKIGFSTLLGESQGQQMMDDLDAFAKATPFKSSEVISQTQRMLAMGWDAKDIITDMETIGDAAAATGKGEQGLQQIVTALSQIKTKGRLSTEELNQLAEAGISAKRYIAEGLGYGSGDEGIAKMTKDLEDGAIASGEALQALLGGMQEYQGMMAQTANETVSGLWSQIEDTFEINIARRWGQGLQDGLKKSFGSIVEIIDEADSALNEFGDTIYDVGSNISNWTAERLENAVKRITEITGSYEFKEASLGEKVSMLWNGVIVDPLKEWWEGGGQEKTAETAGNIGKWLGETLTSGLLAVLGITDIFADSGLDESGGVSVAQSFAQGFVEGFDVSAITGKLVDAIGNVWGALPAWAKILIGGYVGGKAISGLGNLVGGAATLFGGAKGAIGSFGIANSLLPHLTSSGTGILGTIGKAGVGLGASATSGALLTKFASTTGGALLTGAAGITGGLAAGASTIKGISDLRGAYKEYKYGSDTEAKAKAASGGSALGGVAAGAAIGSIIPGVGTALGALVGAGIGGIAGWIGGEKWAKNIREAKYEIEGAGEAIENATTEEEKLAQKNKAAWESMKSRMGDIKLTASEITRLTDQIVWGDDLGNFEKFNTATKQAQASLQSLKSASEEANRWMWKASLGVKFNDDEKESFKASFDEYVNSAQSYVENKHYEFQASASLILDLESEEGKGILESGNAFYKAEQEKLTKAGKELGDLLTDALKDGIINADEEKAIVAAQQKITEITNKIAKAEAEAEIEVIKVKFGSGNLDLDSFDSFMESMQTNLEERMANADEALEVQIANLKLRYPDGGEKYKQELETIIEGYEAEVDSIKANVLDVELNIIGDAYKDKLGDDVVSDLQKVLEYSLENDVDPVEIELDKLCELVGVEKGTLEEDVAQGLQQMLSGVYSQLELLEVDGELYVKLGVKTEEGTGEKVEEKVKSELPETVESTVGVNIKGEKEIQNTIDILTEDFDIPPEHAATVALLLTGNKEIMNQIDVSQLAKEFNIPESQAKTLIMKLTGEKSIENRLNILASEFGIPDSISKTIKVNFTAIKGAVTNLVGKVFGARGGIFGGSSSQDAFARGGIAGLDVPGYSDGGMVRGGAQLITVAEEGTPEMIIPLSSQRRGRALKLWAQAGHMLDVPGFARGGIIGGDGGRDEGIRFTTTGFDSSGGQNVTVEVGGISVTIHVDATGHTNIAEAIQEQGGEIAETVAGILADAFGAQFENTPTRGGAA